jgi:hypothetical protein
MRGICLDQYDVLFVCVCVCVCSISSSVVFVMVASLLVLSCFDLMVCCLFACCQHLHVCIV